MKLVTAITFFLFLPFLSDSTMTLVGYHSRFAKIWRFYEQDTQGNWVPKILVYNITNKPITVCMKVAVPEREITSSDTQVLKKFTGPDNNTSVRLVTIPQNGYGIYESLAVTGGKSTYFYDSIVINGEAIGYMEGRRKLELTDKRHRYYSYEGIDGVGYCLMGTDNLFVRPGEVGHISLYYRCDKTQCIYPDNEWQLELYVYKGIASVTLCKEDGECFTAGMGKPNVKFPVNIEKLDSFVLEANYLITSRDPFPEVCLRKYFCKGSISATVLPIFLK